MKVTRNWLRNYIDVDWAADELAERLTILGVEVEGIQKIGGEFEGVVVAQILASEKHPNADKLSVCRVADGHGERQIVCGAKNYRVGDKVPLALPGAMLPAAPGEPAVTIKTSKMRGVESQGMLCSGRELQLSNDAEGLMILAAEATVGAPLAEFLGCAGADAVLDLEITPNRPDWNSVLGLAREIHALTGAPLRLPEIRLKESAPPAADAVQVRIEDPDLCPRYTARVIRGVTIGPSPDWLREALEKVGLRSINNVVDATNFVMLETGQPLHAFDYRLLGALPERPPTIVVRRARSGETFVTLDGRERNLTSETLLISDETKAVALAGVMGGQNSEINAATSDVLLESAYFQPQNIRRTSKQLDLRTDASYRFERGADIGVCDWASQRAAQLILETAGGQLLRGAVDAYPAPPPPRTVSLRAARVGAVLGVEVPAREQRQWLERLGLEIAEPSGDRAAAGGDSTSVRWRIPTFRVDLKREIDLIEELARLYGVDRIPATPPRGAIGAHPDDAAHDCWAEARRLLIGLGFNEAQGQTLISNEAAHLALGAGPEGRWAAEEAPSKPTESAASEDRRVFLENPLSSEMDALRPSLLPGLLDLIRHNLNHQVPDIAVFEAGRVFVRSGAVWREESRLALAMTGARQPDFWEGEERRAHFDIFDLKGALEEFFEQYGVGGVRWIKRERPDPFFLESATLQLGRQTFGELGQLTARLAKRYDARHPVLLAELNFDLLLARRHAAKSFKALPAFPAIRRDAAMLVDEAVTHRAVLNAVQQAKPAFLEKVELFDVFRGANLPAGQKSVAYAFTYRSGERTLTDAEVNAAHEKLAQALQSQLRATLRA